MFVLFLAACTGGSDTGGGGHDTSQPQPPSAPAQELEAALARLPEQQREAVLLCDLWGFRYGEIAAITDVPVGTVRARISRARSELARIRVGS